MNVILIDADCKKNYLDEMKLREILNDSGCQIFYLAPNSFPKLESGCRCVLLTAMSGGLKKYHRDLIFDNMQVRQWVISIVGISFKSEQTQLMDSINTVLAERKVSYTIYFEDLDKLEATKAVCGKRVDPQKLCVLVSRNETLLDKFSHVVKKMLDEWRLVKILDGSNDYYEQADVILAIGEKEEDFVLKAPQYGMGRTYVWVENKNESVQAYQRMAYNILTEQGWSLRENRNIFCGQLDLEEWNRKLENGETSFLVLCGSEDFVLWDDYGLPMRNCDYTEDKIHSFLRRQCSLEKMISQFN